MLFLADGQPFAPPTALPSRVHLLQVRCADGAVSSIWAEVAGSFELPMSCSGHGVRRGTGVNDQVLNPSADGDLVRIALFGPYSTDATMRLAALPPVDSGAPASAPPPEEPAKDAEAPRSRSADAAFTCPEVTVKAGRAARMSPRWVSLSTVRGDSIGGPWPAGEGTHVLRADVRGDDLVVLVDDMELGTASTRGHAGSAVAFEVGAGGRLGRFAVCTDAE